MLSHSAHPRSTAVLPEFWRNGMHRSRSLIVREVRARLERLILLRDSLEGLAILL